MQVFQNTVISTFKLQANSVPPQMLILVTLLIEL